MLLSLSLKENAVGNISMGKTEELLVCCFFLVFFSDHIVVLVQYLDSVFGQQEMMIQSLHVQPCNVQVG